MSATDENSNFLSATNRECVYSDNDSVMWLLDAAEKEQMKRFSQKMEHSLELEVSDLLVGSKTVRDKLKSPHRTTSPKNQQNSRSNSPTALVPQTDFQYQHITSSPPVSPKVQTRLKGVTKIAFEGNSTVSPYLEHLTTSNPMMGNASKALSRLHLEMGLFTPSASAKDPKGFAIIQDGNNRDRNLVRSAGNRRPLTAAVAHSNNNNTVTKSSRIIKSASLANARSDLPESRDPSMLRVPSAKERVAAFKARVPDISTNLSVRALRAQQDSFDQPHNAKWMSETSIPSPAAASNTNQFRNLSAAELVSALQQQHGSSQQRLTNIDSLVSSLRYPQNALPKQLPSLDAFRAASNASPQETAHRELFSTIRAQSPQYQRPSQSRTPPVPVAESHLFEPDQFSSTVDLGRVDSSIDMRASLTAAGNNSNSSSSNNINMMHDIHKDPLYRVLREECDILRRNAYRSTAAAEITKRKRLKGTGHHSMPVPVENMVYAVADSISVAELKILRSFISLPPAAWITVRIVYFILVSYYECFLSLDKDTLDKSIFTGSKVWDSVQNQYNEEGMNTSSVEKLYSWSYMQELLRNPQKFIKSLREIEIGNSNLPAAQSVIPGAALKVNEFADNLFYSTFPLDHLQHLRALVQHGQGLFQESAVITTVPVCAKLCSWAKKVIANIYSSCLERLRSSELAEKEESHVLKQEGVLGTASSIEHQQPQPQSDHAAAVAPSSPVMRASSALRKGISIVTALAPASSEDQADIHTLTTAVNLTSHSAILEVLVPPNEDSTAGITAGGESTDMLSYYERQLRHMSASPLHRVVQLQSASSDSNSNSFNNKEDMLDPATDPRQQQHPRTIVRAHTSHLHLSTSKAGVTLHSQLTHCISGDSKPDLLVTSRQPGLIMPTAADVDTVENYPAEVRNLLECGRLSCSFSLVLSTSSSKRFSSASGMIEDMQSVAPGSVSVLNMLDGSSLVSESAPPLSQGLSTANTFVVCVSESKSSWSAFKLICKLAKPTDTVVVMHIPVIGSRGAADSSNVSAGLATGSSCSSHTAQQLQRYDSLLAETKARIAILRSKYATAGYNLYVDQIPDKFSYAMHSAAGHFQRSDIDKRLVDRNPLGSDPAALEGGESGCSTEVSKELYDINQDTGDLARRILKAAQTFRPTFIVLGSTSVDIALALSSAHASPLSESFPCSDDTKFNLSAAAATISRRVTGASKKETTSQQQSLEQSAVQSARAMSAGDSFIYTDNEVFTRGNTATTFTSDGLGMLDGGGLDAGKSIYEEGNQEPSQQLQRDRDEYNNDDEGDCYEEDLFDNDSFIKLDTAASAEGDYYQDEEFDPFVNGEEDLQHQSQGIIAAVLPNPNTFHGAGYSPLSRPQAAHGSRSGAVHQRTELDSPGNLSYSASILPDFSSPLKYEITSPAAAAMAKQGNRDTLTTGAAIDADTSLVADNDMLRKNYTSFLSHRARLVETVLHLSMLSKSPICSFILSNNKKK